jgi:hypothetical protein
MHTGKANLVGCSDWSLPPVSTTDHHSPNPNQSSQVEVGIENRQTSSSTKATKQWAFLLIGESLITSFLFCHRSRWMPVLSGLIIGILSSGIILTVVLLLWLKSPQSTTTLSSQSMSIWSENWAEIWYSYRKGRG